MCVLDLSNYPNMPLKMIGGVDQVGRQGINAKARWRLPAKTRKLIAT